MQLLSDHMRITLGKCGTSSWVTTTWQLKAHSLSKCVMSGKSSKKMKVFIEA